MDHIKETLVNLSTEPATPSPKIIEDREAEWDPLERLRLSLGVSTLDNTFATFKKVNGAREACSAFLALSTGKTKWQLLLCYGGVGNGKTHLCEALVIALYKRGLFTRLITMSRLMGTLKRAMNQGAQSTLDELVDRYSKAQRLVIDDVGMGGSGSEWEWGQLEEIIVNRYRDNLLTVLTSNLDLKQIPERIVSRFGDREKGRIVLNEAPDYRPEKGKKDE